MECVTPPARHRRFFVPTLFAFLTAFIVSCGKSPSAPSTPTLRVSSVMPNSGSTLGGSAVTIAGTEFMADTAVTIAGVPAASVTVQSASTLNVVLGARPTGGTGDVVVTSGGRSVTLAAAFTYVAPSGANRAPVVTSIRSVGSRAGQPSGFGDFEETIALVPSVSNDEAASTLSYEWSGPGSFTPSADGNTQWRLPSNPGNSPVEETATLIVSERFDEGGVTHIQKSTPAAFRVVVHDSKKEVLDMGEDFLTRFTRQEPVAQVLHNFSRTCDNGRGRADEENDTIANQARFTQNVAAFRITRREPFTINFRSVCLAGPQPPQPNVDACSSFAVHWEGYDRELKSNFVTNGIDYVSAVLESDAWRLCHSSFEGTAAYPSLGLTLRVRW